jgi:very-short-patch-repair endonuclease
MLNDLLRDQDGVLTLAQARRVGISKDAAYRRVRAGQWLRCSAGVYFADDRPFDDRARIRAAVWSFGELAAASGLAAAWWLHLTRYAPDVVEVTVPRDSNGRARAGCRVRRRDLSQTDIVERDGLLVTSLPLTVVEASVRRGGGPKLMDNALQQHTDLRSLWSAHLRNKGRYGSPAARRLLQAADEGTRSAAERLFAQLLKNAGIGGWKPNQIVAGYEVDFLFRAAQLAVEVDGFAFHSDPESFNRDRNKQNAISLAGNQILRFTWIDLTEHPDRVIAEVKRAIRAC